MTQVKLSCGFEGEINEEAVNDIEFLEAVTMMAEDDNPMGLIKICNLLMSPEDKKRLYELCKDENGIKRTDRVGEQVSELISQLKAKKK
jgi:hypothetical protein